MKGFWIGVLTFVLKMVDIDVTLKSDVLRIVLEIGGKTVVDWEIDLVKEKSISGSMIKNSQFKSARVSL